MQYFELVYAESTDFSIGINYSWIGTQSGRLWVTREESPRRQLMKLVGRNFNYASRSFAFSLNHSKLINSNFYLFLCLSLSLSSLFWLNRTACLFAFNKQCSHFMGVNLAHLKTVVQFGSHWSLSHSLACIWVCTFSDQSIFFLTEIPRISIKPQSIAN